METHESKVRAFYDAASACYEHFMGDRWHHGDPEAERAGKSFVEACQILEEKVLTASGLTSDGWALDFGSGIGGPTLHMASVCAARFVGVTNNDNINRRARQRAAEAGLGDRVSFLTIGDTDYQYLPFRDESFEAVFFYESVCHLSDKAALFREAGRVLKRGGRIAGIDWLQRPFGEYQTAEQIETVMGPVNEFIRIPWHGTVAGYREMMERAGLDVLEARDLFDGVECWGSTPDDQRDEWLAYGGPEGDLFQKGKVALDAARRAGVFTVGMFVAEKPSSHGL
jgi:tocopherol O-methyltransferase